MWFHDNSDALARLRALGAYAYTVSQSVDSNVKSKKQKSTVSVEVQRFCDKHLLHQPSLERSLELTRQLNEIYDSVFELNNVEMPPDKNSGGKRSRVDEDGSFSSSNQNFFISELKPPTVDQESTLRQIMFTGLTDCIARRARVGIITTGSRRKRLTAYFSCNPAVTVPLYIHPESCLFKKDPMADLPEFVMYAQLVNNESGDATYMTSVSKVESSWIHELAR